MFLYFAIAAIILVGLIVLINILFDSDSTDKASPDVIDTSLDDASSDEEEISEPELLFTNESYYSGNVNGYKTYEHVNSYTYEQNYDTLESLFNDAPPTGTATLSAVLTKVDEPLAFYVTDSYRKGDKATVDFVYIYEDDEVTSYSFLPNNYAESNPETVLTINDFIGKTVDEVATIADENQKLLFELTREEIISENEYDDELIFQYSSMDYFSPKPQPFEIIFPEAGGGQLIRKYTKINLENKGTHNQLMGSQLDEFNDYHVTYNILREDKYSSIPLRELSADFKRTYLIGFKTGNTSFVTIYEGNGSDKIRFDHEDTSGINTEDLFRPK